MVRFGKERPGRAESEPIASKTEREYAEELAPKLIAAGERFRALPEKERKTLLKKWDRGRGVKLSAPNDWGFEPGPSGPGSFNIVTFLLMFVLSGLLIWIAFQMVTILGLGTSIFLLAMSFLLFIFFAGEKNL